MSSFRLHAPYPPAGDQPRAIREIVEAFRRGERYVTLLGVTGSGKSIAPWEPVWIQEDGHWTPVPIEDLFLQQEGEITLDRDHTLLHLSRPLPVLAMDRSRAQATVSVAPTITRHPESADLFRVETSTGRVITVTGDHSLYIQRDERLFLIPTHELKVGDKLPVPGGEFPLDDQDIPLAWEPVRSIHRMVHNGWVYDLTVPGTETFLAGEEGIFVHNTYTVANVIAELNRPTLILSHNKTLAAQLFAELKGYFPENAVEYFISYYDYYQPEAYVPATDTYIEKEADINEDIERLRLRTTASLLSRRDVIVVASVSAIYALGDPEETRKFFFVIRRGTSLDREEMLRRLVELQYTRNDAVLKRGTFRARGDVVEVIPAYEEQVVRVEFWGDEVERLTIRDPLTGEILEEPEQVAIYPAGHWLTSEEKFIRALQSIEEELRERLKELEATGKILEARRLEQRTRMDLELLRATGTCPGVENYSRHLSGRAPGERPHCLIDYFPEDFLLVIDESHVTIPQLQGMYRGDRARKKTLVEYGFRLPSALDNRPLRFEELEALWNQVLFVSATPGPYELEKTGGWVVEQIIRPTGLVDPEILVKPTLHQMDVILDEVRKRAERGERVLITTLTKRMAEDLADYLVKHDVQARYLHSELDAIERVQLLRDLRLGAFDVLVGVNLLREGLDLPEVSLVMILDADKTGFLRSERSLIQMAGRAARNAAGQVILFADEITPAMERAIRETHRRRQLQLAYNKKHGIVPRTIRKSPEEIMRLTRIADERVFTRKEDATEQEIQLLLEELSPMEALEELERRMKQAADLWEFERAARYRDAWLKLKETLRSGT